jgi:cellulose biosynthesis protein BcsQ
MIISIASQKGGTGKTLTSMSLSAGLARKGKQARVTRLYRGVLAARSHPAHLLVRS